MTVVVAEVMVTTICVLLDTILVLEITMGRGVSHTALIIVDQVVVDNFFRIRKLTVA